MKTVRHLALLSSLLLSVAAGARSIPNSIACEAMLTDAAPAASDQGALGALAQLRAQLDPSTDARAIRELGDVESKLKSDPDAQVLTLVFRGGQVAEGRRLFMSARERLAGTFHRYLDTDPRRRELGVERTITTLLFAAAALQFAHGAEHLAHEGLNALKNFVGLVNVTLMVPSFAVLGALTSSRLVRESWYDHSFGSLASRLGELADGSLRRPYVWRGHFRSNAGLVSELLRADVTEETRLASYRMLSSTFVGVMRDHNIPMIEAKKLLDNLRDVHVRHLLFYDQSRDEPVWVFVMRSERGVRKGGRMRKEKVVPVKPTAPLGWPGQA